MEDFPSFAQSDPVIEHHSSPPMTGRLDSSPQSLIDDQDVQRLLEQYPFAAEASYFTRPNRYEGPASTWRSWTAGDRAVADALDQERATDLSVHLFNAFALRKKPKVAISGDRAHVAQRSKSKGGRSGPPDEGQDGHHDDFAPSDLWTAWPLLCKDVPRPHESRTRLIDRKRFSLNVNMMPSARLEEALIAITLKHAKERWNGRETEHTRPRIGQKKRDWKLEKEMTMQQSIELGVIEQERDNNSEHQDTMGDAGISGFEDTEAASESDVVVPEGTQTFSSQAFLAEDSSPSESESLASLVDDTENQPAFTADESEARRLLMPSTRHILSKLDDLLTGLHKARRTYATRDLRAAEDFMSLSLSRSRSRARSIAQHSETEATADQLHIRTGTLRSIDKQRRREQRGRKRRRSLSMASASSNKQSSVATEVPEDDNSSIGRSSRPGAQHSRSSGRQSGARGESYGLRDWSDIIGMATLTGWKTETVACAAERCARLFGENMTFRTFHEADLTTTPPLQKRQEAYYEEEFAYVPDEDGAQPDGLAPGAAALPYPSRNMTGLQYMRSSSPCMRCRLHKLRCSPPSSVTHEAETDQAKLVSCAACASSEKSTTSCSGITVKLKAPKSKSRTCPYPDCHRHTIPFPKRYHLERHLRDVHSDSSVLPTSDATQIPSRPSSSALALRPRSDGLACPVLLCPQNSHFYSRPTRLYAHIRKEHPGLDLERYKSLLGQNSGRGKYDRSQSRSMRGRRTRDDESREQDMDDSSLASEGSVEGDIEDDGNHVKDDHDQGSDMKCRGK